MDARSRSSYCNGSPVRGDSRGGDQSDTDGEGGREHPGQLLWRCGNMEARLRRAEDGGCAGHEDSASRIDKGKNQDHRPQSR